MIPNGRILRLCALPILAWLLISGIACCCMSSPGTAAVFLWFVRVHEDPIGYFPIAFRSSDLV
jgi:hypothetical protein